MADMICSLVEIPPLHGLLETLREKHSITIRRPNPWEAEKTREFILRHFSAGWSQEAAIAFTHQPVTAFIALHENKDIVGFACYECTRKDYFGPTGVDPAWQGKGIGRALFLAALIGLRELGYTYAIIGDAGPVEFYRKTVGAKEIGFGDGRGIYTIKEEPGLLQE